MRKLKVYAVNYDGRSCRIVAATSQKEAAALIGTNLNQLRTSGGETWNAEDISVAMQEPGAVYSRKYNGPREPYVRVGAKP